MNAQNEGNEERPIYPAGLEAPRLQFAQVELLINGLADWREEGGKVRPCRLGALTRAAFKEAQHLGYVRPYTPPLANAWRAWTEARGLPYVAVSDHERGVSILVDFRRVVAPDQWEEVRDTCRQRVTRSSHGCIPGEGHLTVLASVGAVPGIVGLLHETVGWRASANGSSNYQDRNQS